MNANALKLEDLTQDQRQFIKRSARLEWAEMCAQEGDILGWGQAIMPHKFTLPFCPPFHEYLISIIHDPLTGTEGPRNHAKTVIACTLVPTFLAIYQPQMYTHYLNVQSTGLKADSVNVSIRHEFEMNDLLRELCGDLVGDDKWTDSQFMLSNGVIFSAIGAGASIRGMQSLNIRPNYINVDDLFDKDHINNIVATQKMNDWFWGDLYPARDKAWPARVHVTGTAINNYDLLEKMKKMSGTKFRSFKAIQDDGTILWPELNSREQLEIERINMGSLIFAREMQNERRDETTAIIKRSWLYPTDGSPDWEYDPAELKFDRYHLLMGVYLLCDPSIGEKVQNDFTATILMLHGRHADALPGQGDVYYIHDARNEHLSLDKRIKLLSDMAAEQPTERPVSEVRIEAIAGFKDFCAEVKRRTNLPVKEIDVVKDKISNLENKSPFFENRKMRLNARLDPKIKDQIVFQITTNYPEHDDLRDAVLLGPDAKSGAWNFV